MVRQGSAKASFVGSIPTLASSLRSERSGERRLPSRSAAKAGVTSPLTRPDASSYGSASQPKRFARRRASAGPSAIAFLQAQADRPALMKGTCLNTNKQVGCEGSRRLFAKLLNCSTEDVAILVSAGKLRPLGKPKPNNVKFFSSIELITLLADRD